MLISLFFEINSPISYRNKIGKANNIWDIISGGVKIAPKINAATTIYDLFFSSVLILIQLNFTAVINNNGTSNANPNAKKSAIIICK